MPVLFCNIAWMKDYGGRSVDDPPLGGGAFPNREGFCGEECNFVEADDGYVYGHFETIKGKLDPQVRIENLGADKSDGFIDGVDIVWTAPEEGRDPRMVVGWYRNARLYRLRQEFRGRYPSAQHQRDKIRSFMAKTLAENAFVLRPEERHLLLQRGEGWSGQASWWYAEDTTDRSARAFVRRVKAFMDEPTVAPIGISPDRDPRRGRPAGAAATEIYKRYVTEYEVNVHPQHHKLQEQFVAFLSKQYPRITFPNCFRDDLRFAVRGMPEVMVEIKPADPATVRFAIRAAIGQLLDYRQHQRWSGRQIVLVGAKVTSENDLSLALDHGFGLAWPIETGEFEIRWPDGL